MSKNRPRLSIGLPVYNGENFLKQSLDSLLTQTYTDFELIISDNASSDGTQEICAAYAERDPRIRYYRQPVNLGASENYNFVFKVAECEFFKWAAHDDLYAPTFLECCMDALAEREDIVLAFTLGQDIDEAGSVVRTYPSRGGVHAMNRIQRFHSMVVGRQPVIPVFGVLRSDVLARTKLIGKYTGSDRPLLGELALRGKMVEIPEHLFYYRVHPGQSWGGGKNRRAQQAWYDPAQSEKRTFPSWRLLLEHELSIWRVPMSIDQRIKLHGVLLSWVRTRWRLLFREMFG